MARTRLAPKLGRSGIACLGLLLGTLGLGLATGIGCGGSGSSGSSGDPGAFAGTYAGTFDGDDAGTFTVTVDDMGDVTGDGDSDAEGAFTITGTVNGAGNLSGTTSTGATWNGSFGEDGLDGTWTDGGDNGTFTADEV